MRSRNGEPPVTDVMTPVDLLRGLAVMAEPPEAAHVRLAEVLGLPGSPGKSEYSDLFLFQLYPFASVYLGAEGMIGGEARDRISGFWIAVGHSPPDEPDHLAALLALYSTLAEYEDACTGAERSLTRQCRNALLGEHLAPWVFSFLGRVSELAGDTYGSWADLLSEVLWKEVAGLSVEPPAGSQEDVLPQHLGLAPDLPDPRVKGAAAFIAGVLAPVRSGMILARADIARIASGSDLGLRAGERAFALEYLLAQDSTSVLRGLADEARRQGEGHQSREDRLGPVARFGRDRCATSAHLFGELATDPIRSEEHAAMTATQ